MNLMSRLRSPQPVKLDEMNLKLGRLAEKGRLNELREALDTIDANSVDGSAVDAIDANGFAPVHHACSEGHVEILQLLLDHGASVNTRTFDGETALHLCSSIGYESCVEHLLAAGARTEVKTATGKSAADLARQMGHVNILEMLVAAAPESDGAELATARATSTLTSDARDGMQSYLACPLPPPR